MFIKALLLLVLFVVNSYGAIHLKSTYYVDSQDINLSTLLTNVQDDVTLFSFFENKTTKRVKAKKLIQLLKKYSDEKVDSKHSYIKFIKSSPIDTTKIKNKIYEYYSNTYHSIQILDIEVHPRTYIQELPKHYTLEMSQQELLSNQGTLFIKTLKKRKIFFNYIITASLPVYVSKKKIKKKTPLTQLNLIKKSIMLRKFRSLPIQDIKSKPLQSKHHIKEAKVITSRDVEELSLVQRNSNVSVTLNNKNISIEFSAKSLQDGKLGDIITIQKKDLKRIKAVVVGKNRVEIQ